MDQTSRAEHFVDVASRIANNVWAFLLFLLAGGLAMLAHFGHNKDLLVFAGSIATTGATLFRGQKE